MKRLYAFRELEKNARLSARGRLLCEMESLYSQWKNVKGFVSEIMNTGIIVDPKDVYVTDDDNVIFLPREIVLDAALQQSCIGMRYLSLPEYRELFLANAKATIRQIRPFPSDVRFVLISVEVFPFENNDNGNAFFACEVAASMLEIYLNHLVVTISNSFRLAIIREHSRISSPSYLDGYLENMGEVFLQDGSFAPIIADREEASYVGQRSTAKG